MLSYFKKRQSKQLKKKIILALLKNNKHETDNTLFIADEIYKYINTIE